ncbi:hypothetical protein BRADI_4g31805v3 [Brachypodium distachyon]|uniref:Uncharacterized protein n=1 Tax=Brachypodium distachyon TaxID=15368 RepID=A0A2K2CRN9_BRADI|nr:hypothetical protein BRADI_4g31805v3 [Brachypodium distachyon]
MCQCGSGTLGSWEAAVLRVGPGLARGRGRSGFPVPAAARRHAPAPAPAPARAVLFSSDQAGSAQLLPVRSGMQPTRGIATRLTGGVVWGRRGFATCTLELSWTCMACVPFSLLHIFIFFPKSAEPPTVTTQWTGRTRTIRGKKDKLAVHDWYI